MTEYQPRTVDRLIEILLAQDENPRSWQREAARAFGDLRELNAVNESGCERALQGYEAASKVVALQSSHIEVLEKARSEMDALLARAADILNIMPNMNAMDLGFEITKFRLARQSLSSANRGSGEA